MTQRYFRDFENAARKLKNRKKPLIGRLGYRPTDGTFQVEVDGDSRKYWVVFEDRSATAVLHQGRVPPIPRLLVEVANDPQTRELVIVGALNTAENLALLEEAGNFNVGKHHHRRYSGMAFPIDIRLLEQLSVHKVDDTSLTVFVRGGRYDWNGVLYYLPSTQLSLSANVPTTPDMQRWSVVCIDTTTDPHELIVVDGTDYDDGSTLGIEFVEDIDLLSQRYIPLTAVNLHYGQTNLVENNFEALYPIATGMNNWNGEDLINSILTDIDGQILVDADGNVLMGI
jgi:hypothetical protein